MKLNRNLLYVALASMLTVGCADLDTEPQGSTVTADQKKAAVEANPSRISASVTGITTLFSVYGNVYGTSSLRHNDFGYPSIMLFLDSRGIDLVGSDVGYNWYSDALSLTDRTLTGYTSTMHGHRCIIRFIQQMPLLL